MGSPTSFWFGFSLLVLLAPVQVLGILVVVLFRHRQPIQARRWQMVGATGLLVAVAHTSVCVYMMKWPNVDCSSDL